MRTKREHTRTDAAHRVLTMSYLLLVGLLVFGSGLMGCKGPTGPQGARGEQGQHGEQGTQGKQGPEGTANVIYSDWTAFDVSNWTDAYSTFGQMRRDYPIDEPLIEEEILATGTVMVFVRIPTVTGETVFPLPWIYHLSKGLQQVLGFELEPGSILINFYDLVDDSVDPGTFGDIVEYRYIIIPGGTSAAKNKSLDLNDYYAVINYFDIKP